MNVNERRERQQESEETANGHAYLISRRTYFQPIRASTAGAHVGEPGIWMWLR